MLTQYVCDHARHGRAGKDTITVRPTGAIGLGKRSVDDHSLQSRTDALLFYDADKDLIAVKFLDEPQHGSVPVRQHNSLRSITHGGFAKHYEAEQHRHQRRPRSGLGR